MGNSLLEIKPHQVSRDLKGYSVLLYGTPKSGKTTIASRFPGALVLAFEKGYSAIPGIMAMPINSWGEFKKSLNEMRDPAVKEKFQTIVIDTADIAYQYCEKYICSRESTASNSYETIGDVPFGKGYKLAQNEFDECIRKILQMDYGLVLISHDQDKVFTDEQGKEYNKIIPTLDTRCRLVCERTCDIIGYSRIVEMENGTSATKLFLRETPRFMAGSRFKFIAPVIDFNYESLVEAIGKAVDAEAEIHGANAVIDEKVNLHTAEEKVYDFDALKAEFQEIVGNLMTANPSIAPQIASIVDSHLGKGKKVADCGTEQAEQLDLILFELKKL